MPTIMSIPEMVDSAHALILTDQRIKSGNHQLVCLRITKKFSLQYGSGPP